MLTMQDEICAACGTLGRFHLLAFDAQDRIVAAVYHDRGFVVCATGEDAYREKRTDRVAYEWHLHQVAQMNEEYQGSWEP